MEHSEVPFISEYKPGRTTLPLKQYRPLSTRPWVLLLYLAATLLCFGGLLAVSLVEKETNLNTKRDLASLQSHRVLFSRQATSSPATYATTGSTAILGLTTPVTTTTKKTSTTCTSVFSVTVIIYSTMSGGTSATTIGNPTTTGSCSSLYMTITLTSLLSLTSQAKSSSTTSTSTTRSSTTRTSTTSIEFTSANVLSLTPLPKSSSSATSTFTTTTPRTAATSANILSLTSLPKPTTSTASTNFVPSTSVNILSLTPQAESSSSTTSTRSGAPVSQISDGPVILSLTAQSTSRTSHQSLLASTASRTTYVLSLTAAPASSLATSSSMSSASSLVLSLTTQSTSVLSLTTQLTSKSSGLSSTTLVFSSSVLSLTGQSSLTTQSPTIFTLTTEPTVTTEGSTLTVTVSTGANPSASAKASSDRNSTVDPVLNADLVLIKMPFHNYDYFLAVYLPKLISVFMASVWGIIFAGLKLMEPFYHLSAHSGAFAKDTMFGNYLSSEVNPSSLFAIFRGQWVLLLGGIVLLAWAAVIALVSESMIVISKGDCVDPKNGSHFRCDPGWAVNRPVLDILLALLGIIFILIFILSCIIVRRKRSGVFVDPSSIASMAELLGNPDVMQDIREVDALANDKEARKLLGENRYKLGYYDTITGKQIHFDMVEDGEQRWGLIKLAGDPMPRTLARGGKARYGAVLNPGDTSVDEVNANKRRRVVQMVYDAIMLLTALSIFGLVLGYYLDYKSDPLNDFFNSNTFGPRFVLTILALIVSTGWRRTSQEVTLMTPYRSMARAFQAQSDVPARRSVLAPTACTPYTAFYKGLLLRNYFIAVVAMSAVLSDVLLIAVSGVPFSSGQIKPSLQASSFVSLIILGIMAITSIAVIIHHRTSAGGKRRLPRSPNTLIGVWLYLAGSGLARHVKPDSDEQTADPLDQRGLVKKYDSGRYAFARAVGVDGIYRWTIDEAARLHSARPETLQQPQHHQHQNQSSRPISQRTNDSHGANKMLEATNYDQFRQQQPHTQHSLQRKPLPVPKSAYWQQQQNNHQGQWQHQQQDYPPRPAHQQFEAQAKSSVKQTPQGGFEPLRPTNQIRLPDNRTLQGSQTTQPQYQYSASEQPQQMQESNRFIYRPPALSVRTRANGIWSGSNQYTRYGTDNAG